MKRVLIFIDEILQRFYFYKILSFFLSIIPKDKHLWIWTSYPIYSDSPQIFFKYCQQRYPNVRHVWIGVRTSNRINLPNIEYIHIFSLKGMYLLLRSKVIFTNNNEFFRIKASNQVLIDFWHGIPIKSILRYDKKISKILNKFADGVDVRVSSSKLTSLLYTSVFGTSPFINVETGSIRLDKILESNASDLKSKLGLKKNLKYAVYMPTYRSGYRNKVEGSLDLFNEKFIEDMQLFFKNKNYCLLIKPHPFEENAFKKSNFLITSKVLSQKDLCVSDLLAICDILITDYSSVLLDFLVTKKRFVIFNPDFEKYNEDRGFIIDFLDDLQPFLANDLSKFSSVLSNFESQENRNRLDFLASMYYTNIDRFNCERLLTCLQKKYNDVF